jgi:hypothetical protein
MPLQKKLIEVAGGITSGQRHMMDFRIDRVINHLQREVGDHYWTAIEGNDPRWLEERFDLLDATLGLDSSPIALSA